MELPFESATLQELKAVCLPRHIGQEGFLFMSQRARFALRGKMPLKLGIPDCFKNIFCNVHSVGLHHNFKD